MSSASRKRSAEEHAPPIPDRLSDHEIDMGVLDRFLGSYLRMAYEASYADFERSLGDSPVPPGYLSILTLIANNPGISQTQIGRKARWDKSSVTKALRRMEDEGLIRRARLENDRRTYVSELTEEGAALQATLQEKALEHVSRVVEVIGQARHAMLVDALHDIIEGFQKKPDSDRSAA